MISKIGAYWINHLLGEDKRQECYTCTKQPIIIREHIIYGEHIYYDK